MKLFTLKYKLNLMKNVDNIQNNKTKEKIMEGVTTKDNNYVFHSFCYYGIDYFI